MPGGAEPETFVTLRRPRPRAWLYLASNVTQDLFSRRESLYRAYRATNSQVTSTRLA
jgi:hypothetical protein